MKSYQFVQMDVFSAVPGKGNTLAVVFDADGLSEDSMQSIARWTRLAETTYTFPPTDASTPPESSYAIRMFAPTKEVPFAGHPSVGTATALLDAAKITPDSHSLVYQQGLAGTLPLHVSAAPDGSRIVAIRAPRARELPLPQVEVELEQSRVGLRLGGLRPALMDGGRRWWVIQAASEKDLREWSPAWDGIKALAKATDSMGVCAYAFADDANSDYQVVVRALVGAEQHFEDAASGAANATLAEFLFANASDAVGSTDYVVSQGREVGYDARLFMRRDHDGEIWSGGQTNTVIHGELQWMTAS